MINLTESRNDSFLLTSGVVLTLLITVTVISYTGRIFFSDKIHKATNQMYDPDYNSNTSHICVFSEDAYTTPFEKTPCFNKTLFMWYNPWLRHNQWAGFWTEIKTRNRLELMKLQEKSNKTEIPVLNETVVPTDVAKKKGSTEVSKGNEKLFELVHSIFVGLMILIALLSCWEARQDKVKRDEGAAAKAQERRCTLADFTINRHLRRESQQAFSHLPRQGSLELTAKVTQNLIHQSSLDRAFPKTTSEALTSLQLRRNSMPMYFSNEVLPLHSAATPPSPKLKVIKRQSVDVPGEEICMDLRKKPRHFIRRH